MAGRVNVQVGFSVDKSGLSQMQSLFQQIANSAKEPGNQLNTGLQQAAATANTLDAILEKTFNTNLGTLNVTKFNQELSKSGLTLKSVQADLAKAGNQGATAYNRLSQAILGTNLQLKESNKLLDSMATTMANTVKWGITSSIFNTITQSIQKAYTYSKQLNTSLNDIRIVTDKSADSMERFAEQANEAAKGMGASTLDYTNAALIYYQQGLTDSEVAARAETTIKAANVTGQTGEEVSEQLTAVWNGYKVTAEETEAYVDKLAAVAATTAADLEELSVGMSKVAAAANAMGVDFDDLNAQIATIVSVTRQAPESVGTALKTIYARLGDLKVDGVDEFGVKLGEVSEQMQQMGIQILDQNGDLRDMSSVIAEVADKWGGWTEAQRQAAAVAMAGKRQYNNLIALFDNWDMYTDALNTSVEAVGTLQHQQDIYMESTAAKLKTLKATWQDLYDGIIDDDELNTGIEGLTNLVQVFDNFIDSFGGGIKSIGAFGAIVANIFNKQITDGINAAIHRQEIFKQNLELTQASSQIRQQGAMEAGDDNRAQAIEANTRLQIEYSEKIYNARIGLNQEQANTLINYQKELGSLEEQIVYTENLVKSTELNHLTNEEIYDLLTVEENELQKINEDYGDIEISARNSLDISKMTLDNVKNHLSSEKSLNSIKKDIVAETKILSKEEQEQVEKILLEVNNTDDLIAKREELLLIFNKNVNAEKKNLAAIEEEEKAVERVKTARMQIANLRQQKNDIKQQADDMLDFAEKSKITAQNITTVTSALGTMAMAWSSVSSLFQTWNDESASFGDKITQTFMTLGMTIPMVIGSFNKLKDVFGYTTGILETFQSISVKNSAISSLNAAGYEIEKKALAGKTKAEIEDYLVSQYLLTHEIKINGVRVTNIALLSKEQKAYLLDLMAKETDDEVTKKLIGSQLALNSAMLANPITIVIAALAALAAATAFAIKKYDEYIQMQIDSNNKTIEASNTIQEETNANKELYDSYNKLYNQYQNHEIEKEALYDVTDKLCEKYNLEEGYLAKLTGNYDKLTEAIKRARLEELQQAQQASQNEVNAAERNILPRGQQTRQGARFGETYQVSFDYGVVRQKVDKQAEEILKKYLDNAINARQGHLISEVNANDPQAIIKQYDQIFEAVKEMNQTMSDADRSGSEVFQNAQKYVEEMSSTIEEYRIALDELDDYNVQIILAKHNLEGISSLQEYTNEVESIKEDLNKEFNNDSEKINTLLKTYLTSMDNEFVEIGYGLEILKNQLKLSEEDFKKLLTWSEEDKKLLLSGQIEFDGLKTEEELSKALNFAKNNISEEDLTVAVSLREKISSDKKLTKSQLKEAAGEQSTLTQEYDVELSDFDDQSQLKQLDTLNKIVNDKIELNKKYIENAKETATQEKEILEIRQANWEEEKIILEAKKQGAEHGSEDIFTEEDEAKLKELNELLIQTEDEVENLQELINKGGLSFDELNELNYDNLISGIDGVINEAKVLCNLTDDIGESWTIAADKIENFGKNFPEILESAENYNFLQDGSLQLTEAGRQALEGTLEARKANLNAINEEYQLELQKQADIQQATADYYNQQADLLQAYLDGEADAKETESKMEESLANYKNNLMEIIGDNNNELNRIIQENGNNTRISAEMDEKAIYDYWCSVGEAAEAASLAYENKSFNPPGFNGGGGSGGAKENQTFKAKSAQEATSSLERLDSDQIQKIIDTYRKKAEDASNKAADYISKKIGAQAAFKGFENSADNAISGKGSGKSKGGGGGKDRQEKELKNLDEEFDRYWEIKKAIDAVDRSLKLLEKDKKNLYGTQLIDALKIENNLLEQQKAHYNALLKAQEQEAAELRNQLGTMGVMFDASGAIVNYAEATAKALAAYNAAIQQYNAGLIDETTLGVYEKSFENFKKLLDKYDNLYYKEIQDTKDKLDDIHREQLANNLKAWEVEVELKLNLKELKRGWIDFIKEINEDFKKVYQDLRIEVNRLREDAKTYLGDDGSIGTTIKAIHDVTAEIDKMKAGGSSDMFESISQAQEKLKELNQTLQDNAKALHDLWKEAWKAYLDGIDQVADKFDDLMDQFERINDELSFQGQLIELLYGDKAYDLMDKLYKGQEESLGNQIESLQKQADMWEKLWKDSGATMENQESWTEDQKKYYEEWLAAQGQLNDLVIEYIKLLKNDYLNTVEKVLNELEKSLTGSSLKDMKTDWERISAYSDKYLDNVEQAYEAQKLANKIDQSIASTSNLRNQQKLQALRDKEIKYLREKENLTQYDLDAAEARYQIALKEMALEDARNNKTSMKLVRNEQGNWSYQYLADEEDVQSKQQDLLDAYNNLYQLASDAYESNLEALQTLQEKYLESAREIYLDETLSEEEKEQKLLELRNWYFEQYKLLAEENTLYRNDLATSAAALLLEIYEQDQDAYASMTEAERNMVDELIKANIEDYMDLEDKIKNNYLGIGDSSKQLMEETRVDWKSTAQKLADLWNKDAGGSVRYEVIDAHKQIQKATEEYQKKVDKLAETVKRDFGPEGITKAIKDASGATDELKNKTEDLVNDGVSYLSELKAAIDEIEAAWMSVKDAIEDAIRTLEEYINMMARYNASQPAQSSQVGGGQQEIPAGGEGGSGSGGSGSGGGSSSEGKRQRWVVYNAFDKGGIPVHDQYFDDYRRAFNFRQSLYDAGGRADLRMEYYKTGGYTGQWNGDSGKVAVLHQKELVLNKDDTANFLSGISMLRDMSSINGSISNAIMRAMANMMTSIGRTKASGVNGTIINETNQTEGNTFNITAEFPNANDVNEIREALLSLPNLASQYIARNLK